MGTYAIGQGDLTAGKNYDLTFSSASLSISARPITVTAKPQSKVYGEADGEPPPTSPAAPSRTRTRLIGALDRANSHNVGGYAIRRGTLTAGSNYDLTFEGATLTVTARPITVTADSQEKVYGDADPQLTCWTAVVPSRGRTSSRARCPVSPARRSGRTTSSKAR